MSNPRELPREPAVRQCGPVEMRLPADPELASAVRLTASAMAAAGKCTIAEIDDVKLAVSEVLLALIEHGSGRAVELSLELADSRFVIRGATETRDFDRSHPDLALCETVLGEVCAAHSIDVVESELRIKAGVTLERNHER